MFFQIIAVMPYTSADEQKNKQATSFEKNFNLRKFVYSTPFTLSGNKYGTLKDQCLRNTILTTELSFPYFKKRLRVEKEEQIDLSPIENAITLITDRISATKKEIESSSANLKTIQIVLQGSLLLQVNSGPLEICQVFLANKKEYEKTNVKILKAKMKEFMDVTKALLLINKTLIGEDQEEFQMLLEEGYDDLQAAFQQH